MYDNRPIGIFDSGVGGLSVLREIKKQLPKESFIYIADQAHNPYGGREAEEIQRLASNVVSFLLSKNVKLVVIACNTATVSSISYLREKFNIPIVGVVPVIKLIAEKTKTGSCAVFSTPATAKSKYLSDLISKFGAGKKIHKVGSSGLEHLIEEGIVDGPEIHKAIEQALEPLKTENIDVIALGCTHYPFVKKEIEKVVGPKVAIYDSGEAIARRVNVILSHENKLSEQKTQDFYYTTGDAKRFKIMTKKLLDEGLKNVEHIDL